MTYKTYFLMHQLKPMWLFSIILGILISLFNLFLLLKVKGKIFMIARYLLISFIILFSLYLKANPIFLVLGFAIFPFLVAIGAIKRQK